MSVSKAKQGSVAGVVGGYAPLDSNLRIPARYALWTPDTPPTSPSAYDDEFDTLSGWTTLGTLDTLNVTDFPSNVRMKRADSGTAVNGIFKTAPSMPFTVTCKLADAAFDANYHWVGLLLTAASPGKLFTWGRVYSTTKWVSYGPWTNRTTRDAGYVDTAALEYWRYFRIVVTSSSSVSCEVSHNGLVWIAVGSGVNTTMTVANVGLFISQYTGGVALMEAVFDWIRFT